MKRISTIALNRYKNLKIVGHRGLTQVQLNEIQAELSDGGSELRQNIRKEGESLPLGKHSLVFYFIGMGLGEHSVEIEFEKVAL